MKRNIIKEAFNQFYHNHSLITEGKHWPEDYVKTAFNTIKASQLGQQPWYTDEYIRQDLNNIVTDFGPLSHKNSNLGFFAVIIRWFVEYSGNSQQKYQEFLERKLDNIIRDLQTILNNPKLDPAERDQLKKLPFAEFEKLQQQYADKLKAADTAFDGKESGQYDLIFIESYQQLHKLFGGNKTGYKGQSEWCHTNGKSTYDSWTSNRTRFFFVLAKKGWKNITPPDPKTTNAFDEYGTSLIAILVSQDGSFKNATLRWNHIIEPSETVSGTSVDRAFLTFKSLSDVVGMDVKSKTLDILKRKNAYSKYSKKVYSDDTYICYVSDGQLIWVDANDNEIEPPTKRIDQFDCSFCELTSLVNSPSNVGNFNCSFCGLTSLVNSPSNVSNFDCSGNELTSLEGAPQEVGRRFDCISNYLTSLKGAPKKVGGAFSCDNNKLTSLEGAPREVGGDFNCTKNKLTSLKGAPKKVGGRFNCSANHLTSLEGAPQNVGGDFQCFNNRLTSLEGKPQKIGGRFIARFSDLNHQIYDV